MANEFKCLACDGEGLASSATVEAQQARIDERAAVELEQARRWRLAAEVVLERMTIQDLPALEFIDRVVLLGERVANLPAALSR